MKKVILSMLAIIFLLSIGLIISGYYGTPQTNNKTHMVSDASGLFTYSLQNPSIIDFSELKCLPKEIEIDIALTEKINNIIKQKDIERNSIFEKAAENLVTLQLEYKEKTDQILSKEQVRKVNMFNNKNSANQNNITLTMLTKDFKLTKDIASQFINIHKKQLKTETAIITKRSNDISTLYQESKNKIKNTVTAEQWESYKKANNITK